MRNGALIVAASLSILAQNQLPAGQPPARTGLIVGQVVEGGTNRPIPDAIVTLMGSGPGIDARDRGRRVVADAEGRYFFAELSAGSYSIRAVKPGYPQNFVGNQRATTPAMPGSIDLAAGERRGGVTISLWRFATISGTVVDDAGEPMVGVGVRLFRRAFGGGQMRFVSVNGAAATTDDRGSFRIPELRPGDYVVCVPSSQTTMPIAMFEQNRWQSSEEIRTAISSFQILGYSQNQRIGDVVLMTPYGSGWPPAPADSGRLSVYPTTFHPATTAIANATVFSLKPGEERSAGVMQIRAAPAARVSGTLMGPNGPVPLTAIRLAQAADTAAGLPLDPVTGLSNPTGAFTLLGVPPGQYVLRVMTPRITGTPIPPSTPEKPILWAAERVTVGDSDVAHLTVTLRHTFRVSGRLEFRGSKPPPTEAELTETVSIIMDPMDSTWGGASTVPDRQGTFVTGVAGGSYAVAIEGPAGWHLKHVLREGRDISDGSLEVKGDIADLVIVFAADVSQIAGTVRTSQGAPDGGATIVAFPVDRRQWIGYGSRFPRRVVSTEARSSGAFTLTGLPAGDYFVAAIPDSLLDSWRDPKIMEGLAQSAIRVSLADNEKRSLDLRSAGGR
jgi:Carboxypeptidase regulatory-like domain